MKTFTGVTLVALLLSAGCTGTRSLSIPGEAASGYEQAIERGRRIVTPLVRRGSGVAVAVGVNGRLVWSEGFGRTRLDEGEPVEAEMPFRVYSLMKQVTSVLAMQAALRGDVGMAASVRRVMPHLPAQFEPVTLSQLLNHRGGVRHYRSPAEALMTDHCVTAADALPRFINDPLVAEPGSRESYSTWGFVLASAVLEAAAGVPFASLLEDGILRPARMTSTRLEGSSGAATPLTFYDVDEDGRVHVAPAVDNSCKMGGGGFLASAEDMVHFHDAVLRGELVPMAAVRQMLGERTALAAGGSGPGGQAVSLVDLDTKVSVVILSNTSGLEQQIALDRARGLLAAVFAPDRDGTH
ncbi:MAG TPA: serine hydrolase domain-containing protein [Longimicrobiales bacterium]|nr:serine hydrolase domain-containing protein [Longimicrobiales bacterium]